MHHAILMTENPGTWGKNSVGNSDSQFSPLKPKLLCSLMYIFLLIKTP